MSSTRNLAHGLWKGVQPASTLQSYAIAIRQSVHHVGHTKDSSPLSKRYTLSTPPIPPLQELIPLPRSQKHHRRCPPKLPPLAQVPPNPHADRRPARPRLRRRHNIRR